MEHYQVTEVRASKREKRPGMAWNVFTILVLIVTVCVAVGFILIYINPYLSLNPFPPPKANPLSQMVTATETPHSNLVPTWTPTVTINQLADATTPTDAPASTPTNSAVPAAVQVNAPAADHDYAFEVQQGSPAVIDGAQFHPDIGCNWTGVAGQANSLNGEAVKGLFVLLGGSVPGVGSADNLTMTGMAPQYGQGGFEITLSDKLVASSGTLWLQLLDQQNLPLSDRVYFDTYDDCTKNLVIIYFTQIR